MALPSGSTWRFSNLPGKTEVTRHHDNRETANVEVDGDYIFITSVSLDGRASHVSVPVSTMVNLLAVAGKIK